jgi:hypothetical protein
MYQTTWHLYHILQGITNQDNEERSSSGQGCTNHGRQVTVATKFLTVAQAVKFLALERIICEPSEMN